MRRLRNERRGDYRRGVNSDSHELVVNYINGEYEARDERMLKYIGATVSMIKKFKGFRLEQIGREQNAHDDELAGLASACASSGH